MSELFVPETKTQQRWWIMVLIVLFCIAIWNRAHSLDQLVFQNDEYFHVNTAIGYLKTGHYVQWNQLTDQQLYPKPYHRGWPFTWQVAQSVRLFGDQVWAYRLPALMWGVGFLIALCAVTWSWTKRWSVTVLVIALATWDGTLTWASSYCRMYTMLWTCLLVSIWLWVEAVVNVRRPMSQWLYKQFKKIGTSSQWLMKYWWHIRLFGLVVASLLLIAVGLILHVESLLLIPGYGLFTVLYYRKELLNRPRLIAIAAISLLAIGVVVWQLQTVLSIQFITLLKHPRWEYLLSPASSLRWPWLGIGLLVGSLIWAWTRSSLHYLALLGTALVVPYLIYFTFLADRYAARKYIWFCLPIAWLLMASGWQWLGERWIRQRVWPTICSTVLFISVVTVPSIAGAPIVPGLSIARADLSYRDLQAYQYPAAYQLVEQRADSGSRFAIVTPRYYYLHRRDLQIVPIPSQRQWTVADAERLLAQPGPLWVVFPRAGVEHVLRTKVLQVLTSELQQIDNGQQTNLMIYYRP